MEHKDKPVAIWVVNDMIHDFPGCTMEWVVMDKKGIKIADGKLKVDIPKDSAVRVSDFSFPVETDVSYRVCLTIRDADGNLLAKNIYLDPFQHPKHPKGHPGRMSHELGMRLYWA